MADMRPFEDDATLYVLGELNGSERTDFEARMRQSPELQALVRELETGSLAVATAAPQREPPPDVWRQIDHTISREPRDRATSFWMRHGWAAAACIAVGWLIYALWMTRSTTEPRPTAHRDGSPYPAASRIEQASGVVSVAESPRVSPRPAPTTNFVPPPVTNVLARVGEIALLRRQVRELESQVTQLSQVLTQQQTLPDGFSQVTFSQLVPPMSDDGTTNAFTPPSPELQRALLIALAREMGWLEPPPEDPANPEVDPLRLDGREVEIVDLSVDPDEDPQGSTPRQPHKRTANTTRNKNAPRRDRTGPKPSTQAIPVATLQTPDGPKALVALNSTVVPPDTQSVDISSDAGSFQGIALSGSLAVRSWAPASTVIAIPLTSAGAGGGTISVTARGGFGPPTTFTVRASPAVSGAPAP